MNTVDRIVDGNIHKVFDAIATAVVIFFLFIPIKTLFYFLGIFTTVSFFTEIGDFVFTLQKFLQSLLPSVTDITYVVLLPLTVIYVIADSVRKYSRKQTISSWGKFRIWGLASIFIGSIFGFFLIMGVL